MRSERSAPIEVRFSFVSISVANFTAFTYTKGKSSHIPFLAVWSAW